MVFSSLSALVAYTAVGAQLSHATPLSSRGASAWALSKLTTLVNFGDSYSDDSRLNYFSNNGGKAPPVGWVNPVNYHSADGGRPWPEYVKQYTGANLYNYAVSGAVCSNEVTPRYYDATVGEFPSVYDYEIPAYLADSNYTESNGEPFLIEPVDNTVYNLWLGGNDLGVGAFLTDAQVLGTNLGNLTQCVFACLDEVYKNGGRYFVLGKVAPFELTPLYALPSAGGVGDNRFWSDKATHNMTEISGRMMEQVVTVNAIYQYKTPFALLVADRYPGAHFALWDTYGLFYDIYYNPSKYLNGSAPLNVTGFSQHCNVQGNDCYSLGSPDSYMWYDELHLSEQTARVVADSFVDVIGGSSKWATYWSS